jgi:glycosyltransferase involved in cell wall biosynthesis
MSVNSTPPAGQLWTGWASDAVGFADELRGFLRATEAAGHEPSLANFRPLVPTELTDADRRMIARQEARRPDGPMVAIHSYVPWENQPTIRDQVNVVRAMFETDRLPERRLPLLLDRDEIWVPGDFNLESFERAGIPRDRMHVLGGTLDFDLFTPGAVEPAVLPAPADHFTFLTNFAFSERKAWRQLLHGWAMAFGADDGVCLVLKIHSEARIAERAQDRIDAFLRDELGPDRAARMAPIRIMNEVLPATDMARLYAGADAYVLPTRGEGWGRPFMEAMAMGLPTIGSRWSGNTEFMNDGNSWLVEGDVVPVEHGQEVFLDPCVGHHWFAPSIESLAEQLRAVASDPEAARRKAARARPELLERFGPEVIAARVAELTAGAYERHAERRSRPVTCAFRGPFGSVSSLAVVNDALTDGLLERGHNLWRHSTLQDSSHLDVPTVAHSWPPELTGQGSGPAVVILPWEYGAPPADWVDAAREQIDRVWVPSEYVRSGYVASGMPASVVEVVPNGVDLDHFVPEGPAWPLERSAGCTFLFVGGTIWRKGADLLLEAWSRAFGPEDDVQLVIKDFGTQTHYRGQSVIDAAAVAADPRLAPVLHLTDEVPYRDLPALYRAADVLVAPYRAEGFCLPALEAMACGLPVIHNGAGPTAEFVAEDAGWALGAERRPLPPTSGLDLAQPGWVHEVSVDDLVAALRAAAGDAAERERRGLRAGAAAQDHGWDAAVDVAERSLAVLADEDAPPVRAVRSGVVENRGATVLFAPDWDGDAWPAALACWAREVSADDPVTLALVVGDADLDPLMARVSGVLAETGVPDDALPDLAVCEPGTFALDNLVLGAEAVLLDAGGPEHLPAFARRRARALLTADADVLADFVAALPKAAGAVVADPVPA